MKPVPPTLLLLGSILTIQIGAAIAVNLFPAIGPVAVTFLRLAVASALLVVASRKSIDATARRNVGWIVLFGLVMAVLNLSFYGAISRIPLGLAVAIEFVGPLGLAALTSGARSISHGSASRRSGSGCSRPRSGARSIRSASGSRSWPASVGRATWCSAAASGNR